MMEYVESWERQETLDLWIDAATELGDGWADALRAVCSDLFATRKELDSIESVLSELVYR